MDGKCGETNADRRIRGGLISLHPLYYSSPLPSLLCPFSPSPPSTEVEEYCRQKTSPYMEDKVSSTCKAEPASPTLLPASSAFSPPPRSAPALFRPPGLEESEDEGEGEEAAAPPCPALCSFPPSSYPSMLRLLHPHLYRGGLGLYHPYWAPRYYPAK
jgi:hypothetical protein